MSVARRRRERTDSGEYSDASFEEDNHINSGEDEEGDSEYDSAEHSGSEDLSERESGDGQAAPGSQKGERIDDDEDKRNPQYIPKRGTFYEHDDRTAQGEEENEVTEDADSSVVGANVTRDVLKIAQREKSTTVGTPSSGSEKKLRQSRANAADKWTHDKFNENDQAPKSSEELVSIYGYDIRAEEGPPRAFRRRKYGRGPNKYTRNWEDEKAYGAKTTPVKTKGPPQVGNGEEFPTLQTSNERTKGNRRRNGTVRSGKKPADVVSGKNQDTDKNANNTKMSRAAQLENTSPNAGSNHATTEKALPKHRTAGTGRVGLAPSGPLRRPYAENKESQASQKESAVSIQKNLVPPSAGLPSASLGGISGQEKKTSSSSKKSNASVMPPRMQQSASQHTVQAANAATLPQQAHHVPGTNALNNNNAVNQLSARASPPQQVAVAPAQNTQATEVASGRGKRYSSIRQRPMPEQYQPVQYIADYQSAPQPTQNSQPQPQQQITSLPHRQTPPPSIAPNQQQLMTQQGQQILQAPQMQQQIHQKTPPPQMHQTALHQPGIQQIIPPAQTIHQANPNIVPTSSQLTQSIPSLHQPAQPIHQISPSIQQIHQASPTLHQNSQSVHQQGATLLQTNAQILQTTTPMHQTSPQILQPAPALHPPTANMIPGQQIHQQSTTLITQPNTSLHQRSPSIHQASPTLHQSSQQILQPNPAIHQVSPPIQPQISRQGSSTSVSPMPLRQVPRTHQQMPIHNITPPAHIQGSLPQQGLVASTTYPAQQMIPQSQYIQNSSSNIYSHNIPPQVYQTQPGYAAPPPPLPYHHQPTPPYTGRSVYRESSGITFYSPQEQKGSMAPPPTRRPTNAIPIVPPPSKKDRDRLNDAAAVQKDNIDHIVDNMFVPRQPRNATPRLSDAAKTAEPIASPVESYIEEKSKDGSGDKSSKESSLEPVIVSAALEMPMESIPHDVRHDITQEETLACEFNEKLYVESVTNVQQDQIVEYEPEMIVQENVQIISQVVDECENSSPYVSTEEMAVEAPVTEPNLTPDVQLESEAPLVEEVPSVDEHKDQHQPSGVQDIPVDIEQATIEIVPTVIEEAVVAEAVEPTPEAEEPASVKDEEEAVEKLSKEAAT